GVTVERISPKIDSNANASDASQASQALEPIEEVPFPEPEGQLPEAKGHDLSATRIVGQVLGTYIVLEKEGHLVLVDQHAAHERVVYESLKRRHANLGIQSQDLMVPEMLELTHREADILSSVLEEMAALGVKIEPFGGSSFVIKSIPVLVEDRSIRTMILEMIEQLSRDNRTGAKDDWLDGCLITMACHRAIRANKPMNRPEMEKLIADLWTCENPMHCPHGRPILISFDAYQLEKLFKRVV
ncbi:MAG: DNA mismatch repair protein MutL, partial [Desulfobacterales bacterium]|nr:DNA mismatch repair protein MutL [Desulfobacterales bacterium]